MPIPNPKSGESQSEFISRCVSAIYDEYGEEQSLGICYSKWRETRMEGINLLEDGTVNFDEPCWKNYVQRGMKVKNGELVPNCIPKD
jgi:hypothetical protein